MWERLYDDWKDRRYGLLFFGILAACVVVAWIFLIAQFEWTEEQGLWVGAVLGVVFATMAVPLMRRIKSRRRRPAAERGALSSDELRVARSKLKRHSSGGC